MQYVRGQGGLVKVIPSICSKLLLGNLLLMAFPFLTGYYSKDIIIE